VFTGADESCFCTLLEAPSASFHRLHTWSNTCLVANYNGKPMWISLCHFVGTYGRAKINYHEILTGYWMVFFNAKAFPLAYPSGRKFEMGMLAVLVASDKAQ